MEKIISIEHLLQLVSEIRNLHKGFITNFYTDIFKHGIWIQKEAFFFDKSRDTLFLIKNNETFWNVFYCSTTVSELSEALGRFQTNYPTQIIMVDVVGTAEQSAPLIKMFTKKNYATYSSLVRMSRLTPQGTIECKNKNLSYADAIDAEEILEMLTKYFDARCEQIPYLEELKKYAENHCIIIYKEDSRIWGFVVFESNANTHYLRYWFVYPEHRDKKIGSILLNRFFHEGRTTRRQMFWVITNNDNAIIRYRHYGFVEENLFDYVMSNIK